jgi:NAD(P)H-binding
LGAVDAAGAAKLAEAASRYEHSRFILCSVTGADRPERASGALGDILAAKHHAERRLAELDMPWSILRFGQLTETPGTARIRTTVSRDTRLALSRDDAALTIVEAVSRSHLARQAIVVLDGDRQVADALDAIPPRPLPPPDTPPTGTVASLGAAQSDNPPDASDMLAPDAVPLDADVEWEGDGPAPIEPVDNEDPSPGVP